MLLYIGEPHNVIITAVEGTGDNLLPEDIEDGLVDYWMSSVYRQEEDELKLIDSGQIMTSNVIKEMSFGDQLQHILEYWEMADGTYNILEY